MEAIPLALQIPVSPPPSYPWVAKVMVHQFGGRHLLHDGFMVSNAASEENETANDGNVLHVESIKSRRRPARLVLPEFSPDNVSFLAEKRKRENVEYALHERDYCLVSRKGRRENMEDRYKVITDISGDPNKAFFAVIDGHGGQEAADYVADNLGKNIIKALENPKALDQNGIEQAISEGYFETDREFLCQGASSGACAASVLIRNGEIYAANVGDCRVVLSRRGSATNLTNDHCLSREDERSRVENSGGFIQSYNGVWRVQGTLAVSRAIGDLHLKEYIISEPEIQKVSLNSDCEFLIVASDGLWNKVGEQEAVDVVLREGITKESCKKLVEMSSSRGNKDDITVIVIKLQNFLADAGTF